MDTVPLSSQWIYDTPMRHLQNCFVSWNILKRWKNLKSQESNVSKRLSTVCNLVVSVVKDLLDCENRSSPSEKEVLQNDPSRYKDTFLLLM